MVIFNSYVSLPEGRINVDIGGEPLICTTDRLSEECIMGPKILRHSDEIPFNQSYWNPRKIHSTPISMGFLQFQSYIHPIHLRIFPNFTWRGDRGRVGAMDLPELSARATSCEGHAPPLRTRSGLARWKSGKLPPKKHEIQGNCQEKQMSFLCFFLVETMGSPVLSKKHTMSFGVNDTCRFSMKILEKWCGHKKSPDDSCYVQQPWLPCWCSQFCSRHLDLKIVYKGSWTLW